MRIIFWPDESEDQTKGGGPVRKFLKDLRKHQPKLLAFVWKTFKKVEKSPNLSDLERQKWVQRLQNVPERIYEFRIPPTQRGGVVRIYFAYKPNDPDTIILLSAEKKQGTSHANREKTQQAIERFRKMMK